jgi:hypothetical protein
MRRRLRTLLLVVAVAVTSSGCSADDESPEPAGPASRSPSAERWAACLRDRGWDVEVSWDGGIYAEYKDEQAEQYRADLEECRLEVGFSKEGEPMTEERAKKFYDKWLVIADCVRDLGFDVDDPPSEQAFVEAMIAHEFIWDPITHVPAGSHERVARACDYDGTEN